MPALLRGDLPDLLWGPGSDTGSTGSRAARARTRTNSAMLSPMFDDERWQLTLFDRDLSGWLFVSLDPHRAPWETEGPGVPRSTRCEIEILSPLQRTRLASREVSYRFGDTAWLRCRILDRHDMEHSLLRENAEANAEKSFIISVTLTEYLNSAESSKLNGPPYSLRRVAEMVSLLSTTKPDVRVVFKDRTYIDTHSKILMDRCEYFKTLLTSDFAESRKRTVATPSTSDRPAKVPKSNASQLQGAERSTTPISPSNNISPRPNTQSVREQAVSASTPCREGTHATVKVADNDGEGRDSPIADRGVVKDGKAVRESESATESPAKAGKVGGGAEEASDAAAASESSDGQESDSSVERKMHTIKIRDCSYDTFSALLFYLQTGLISYKQGRKGHKGTGFGLCPARAKAIYQIADKYDIPDLRDNAKRHLLSSLTAKNVLKELVDPFTSLFPTFLAIYKAFAIAHWREVSQTATIASDIETLLKREDTRKAYIEIMQEIVPKK